METELGPPTARHDLNRGHASFQRPSNNTHLNSQRALPRALCQALGPPVEPMGQVLSLQAQVPDKKYENEVTKQVTKRPQRPEHRHGGVGAL